MLIDFEEPAPTPRSSREVTLHILPVVAFTFITYICIGSTLAILPTYVHLHLGVSTVLAGLIISLQYIATFASRPRSGFWSDTLGPRQTVRYGYIIAFTSGILLFASPFLLKITPSHLSLPSRLGFWLSVSSLLLSRLLLGLGESMTGTAGGMWGIARVGEEHTPKVLAWNGVGTYLGLAIGAPLGAILEPRYGLPAVAALITLLCLAAYIHATRLPEARTHHDEAAPTIPMRQIVLRVTPYGLSLALSGMGFGVIATFITLYFAQLHWQGAAFALSVYGISFVIIRITCNSLIARFGGFPVTIASCALEAAGLTLIALTHTHTMAYLGCTLVGAGTSLIFPALGSEAASAFRPSVRGTVIGVYCAFVDFSFFLTGPLAGAIIHNYGYPTVFLSTATAALLAIALTLWIANKPHQPQTT